MTYAPIALFVYKRPEKLKQCIESLENCKLREKTPVYIFCDGPKGEEDKEMVLRVQQYADEISQDHKFEKVIVIKQEHNKGLANSIISGVTDVINQFKRVIVVEDDLIVAPDFLIYMNGALEYYEDKKEYGEISAYTYPIKELETYDRDIYVTRKGECWGWGTWADRWNQVDWNVGTFESYKKDKKKRREFNKIEYGWDQMLINQMEGKLDSWAIRWCYHLFINELLIVYPKISRVINDGFDGNGTHCESLEKYSSEVSNAIDGCNFERLNINLKLERTAGLYPAPKYINFLKSFLD